MRACVALAPANLPLPPPPHTHSWNPSTWRLSESRARRRPCALTRCVCSSSRSHVPCPLYVCLRVPPPLQNDLETVIPALGLPVYIVGGARKGARGLLFSVTPEKYTVSVKLVDEPGCTQSVPGLCQCGVGHPVRRPCPQGSPLSRSWSTNRCARLTRNSRRSKQPRHAGREQGRSDAAMSDVCSLFAVTPMCKHSSARHGSREK